ncbi:hypothetical protein C0J52_25456, partial [Blattella germanica]
TEKRKVQCVQWLAKFESVTRVQPSQLKETGTLLDQTRHGRSSVSDESVEAKWNGFLRSLRYQYVTYVQKLDLRKTTVHTVLKKSLRFMGYRLQLLQTI